MRYTFQTVQGWTDWMAAAEIMRQNLAEVGVAVTVKTLEYNAWDDALKRGRFEMSMGFGSRGPTPYEFYRGQMDGALVRPIGEKAEVNFHRFADPEAEKILRRFEATSDATETATLATELQRGSCENAPSIPALHRPAMGRLQHDAADRFPEPVPSLRQRRAAPARPAAPFPLPIRSPCSSR